MIIARSASFDEAGGDGAKAGPSGRVTSFHSRPRAPASGDSFPPPTKLVHRSDGVAAVIPTITDSNRAWLISPTARQSFRMNASASLLVVALMIRNTAAARSNSPS